MSSGFSHLGTALAADLIARLEFQSSGEAVLATDLIRGGCAGKEYQGVTDRVVNICLAA